MIAVEMMITKLEEGYDKISAATYTYTSTAFPMLTGTLVTVAGFVPVGFAQSGAGEYCFTLFAVVGIALIVSWVVAVLFTPLTGVFILPDTLKKHGGHGGSRFSRWFHDNLDNALRNKARVLAGTVALFLLALVGMRFVQQQFFPASDRPELLVNLTLPQNASLNATQEVVARVEKLFKADPDIDYWSFYVGQGAVRFYLPLDAQLANDFFAQAVVVTKGFKQRAGVQARLEQQLTASFDNVLSRVSPLELGPPVGWPVKFRVSGPDPGATREYAQAFAQVLGENANTRNINYDWNEPSKSIRIEVDQDRARTLGITSQQLANNINSVLSGTTITQLRDSTYLIDIVARAIPEERAKLETLRNLMLETSGGRNVPLAQIASISYGLEPPLIWRRQRLPTVTVQADVVPGVEATTVVKQLQPAIAKFRAELPSGYSVVAGGTVEDSAKAQAQHLRGVSAHAVPDDDHPDGAADELPAPAAGAADGAAGADRRVRGAADVGRTDGLRRHPRRHFADRHGDPQLGDPDRADRRAHRRRRASLVGGDQRHRAPPAADPAHRRRRHPRHDPDRADGVLGADGVRRDGRAGGGDPADAGVPAGALRDVVPHHPAGQAGRASSATRTRLGNDRAGSLGIAFTAISFSASCCRMGTCGPDSCARKARGH